MDRELDGLITFMSSYHALRAERAAKGAGIPAKLVPAPRDLSPTCVTALRFPWAEAPRVEQLLAAQKIEVDRALHYPEERQRPRGWGLFAR